MRVCTQRSANERAIVKNAKALRESLEAQLPREAEKVAKEWLPAVLPGILKKSGKKKLADVERLLLKQKLIKHPKVIEEARRRIMSREQPK